MKRRRSSLADLQKTGVAQSTPFREFILFVAVGGLAATLNIGARLLFDLVLPFEVAIALAYVLALTTAFALNRRFVFRSGRGTAAGQYARFWLVNVIALVQVLAVSVLLARVIFPWLGLEWHADTVAHVIGVLSPVLTSFLLHKTYTFGTSDPVAPDPSPARRCWKKVARPGRMVARRHDERTTP